MDELYDRVLDLMREGFICSQIMLMLSLEMRGRDNPELVRALAGLGNGLHSMETCGTLTGGCCLLASYGAKAAPLEVPSLPYREMVRSFVYWFEKTYGSLRCQDIIQGDMGVAREKCPGLVADCFTKCMEMLTENGVEVTE